MLKLIVAYDENKLIGKGDQLAWNIKEDLEHFKKETINQTILFGDVTFKGIGRPLPNRKTIILTLDKEFRFDHEDVEVVNDMNVILERYKNNPKRDIIISGGATIYKLFLPHVDEMIVSHIKGEFIGDVYFPDWNMSEFEVVEEEDKEEFVLRRYRRRENEN